MRLQPASAMIGSQPSGTAFLVETTPFAPRAAIAYFSMEIALAPEIHTYSGGLGVLAGDTARSCADLGLPVVFVSLVSREGYLRQSIDAAGRQVDAPDPWQPERHARRLGAKVAVVIAGREVWVQAWLYALAGGTGASIPVLLLDTDLDENAAEDRRITARLYGGDDLDRLKQELVLGVGGVRLLRALGFEIRMYHMNEGHSALLAVELLRSLRAPAPPAPGECIYDVQRVRERCIFTTHTPVEAGHDRFAYDMVAGTIGDLLEIDQLKLLGGADRLNMTRLALHLSGYINGVAKRHAETSRRLFPGYRVHAVTNGVHAATWTAPGFARLYERHFPDWLHEPEILVRADQLPDEEVWAAQREAKQRLVERVAALTGVTLDPARPILGFARRMTGYKRADLLFSDLERLAAIARRRSFQVVIAGKAHPRDGSGKALIERIHADAARLGAAPRVVFVPDYEMWLAQILVAGADIWLNTPLVPLEASGTSGMKAALNGGLNFSTLDGWWVEAWIEGRTGWAIGNGDGGKQGEDAAMLYDKLERTILPLYDEDRARWIWMMKEAISKIGSSFTSHRMMRRYASEAYLR
jgi:starch phosphorylase